MLDPIGPSMIMARLPPDELEPVKKLKSTILELKPFEIGEFS